MVNPFKPRDPYVGQVNSADPEQTARNAAYEQGFHCILTECPINILKKYHQTPGLTLLIKVSASIRLKWVKVSKFPAGPSLQNTFLISQTKHMLWQLKRSL